MKSAKVVVYLVLVIMGLAAVVACSNPASSSGNGGGNNTQSLSNNGGTISVTFTNSGVDSTKTFNYYMGGVACAKSSVSLGGTTNTVYTIMGFENGTSNSGGTLQFIYSVAASSTYMVSYMPNIAVNGSLTFQSVATGTLPSLPASVGSSFIWNTTLPAPLDPFMTSGPVTPGTQLKSISINAPLK